MKKKNFLLITILLTMILLSFSNFFVSIFNKYTLFLFILILIFITNWIFGIQEHKSIIEKDIILSIIIYLILYYLIIYIIGYFIGFTKSIYNLKPTSLLQNIFPVIITIPAIELLRYIINTRTRTKTSLIILSYIAFTLTSITVLVSDMYSGSAPDLNMIIEQMGLFIFPIIATNILTTYLSINIGYQTAIVYRYLMEIPIYILPIFPKFGNYIDSILRISIPIFILLWIYNKVKKNEIKKIVIIEKDRLINIQRILMLLTVTIIVYFISGLFRYQALVIATGSMHPDINVGDIVIIDKKSNNKKEYYEGEVITYQKESTLICHRIIKKKIVGDDVYYETKGDFNDTPDQILVESDKVVGKVKYKIKYLGYPTVLLNKYRK